MIRPRGAFAALLACLAALPLAARELGQPNAIEGLRWLDPASGRIGVVVRPKRHLRDEVEGGRLSNLARLGELAFRQPAVLGGEARLGGLSCATCHPNGGANVEFRLPGLSDRPGNVDVTHRAFGGFLADGRANPVNIPSLRGIAATAPYGRAGLVAGLRAFTRRVIVLEFEGDEPAPWLLDALLAYQRQLSFPPPGATRGGEDAMARGRAIFNRPFPAGGRLGCAGCHPPSAAFQDGQRHDVGTGGLFDSPSLRGLGETAPYFHDGRAEDLAAVVRHFDARHELGLGPGEVADLAAYLARIGETAGEEAITLDGEVARLLAFVPLLEWAAKRDFAAIGGFVATALRREAGLIHARLPRAGAAPAREILAGWSRALRALRDLFDGGGFAAARAAYPVLAERMKGEAATVRAAAPGSLYDAEEIERLRQR